MSFRSLRLESECGWLVNGLLSFTSGTRYSLRAALVVIALVCIAIVTGDQLVKRFLFPEYFSGVQAAKQDWNEEKAIYWASDGSVSWQEEISIAGSRQLRIEPAIRLGSGICWTSDNYTRPIKSSNFMRGYRSLIEQRVAKSQNENDRRNDPIEIEFVKDSIEAGGNAAIDCPSELVAKSQWLEIWDGELVFRLPNDPEGNHFDRFVCSPKKDFYLFWNRETLNGCAIHDDGTPLLLIFGGPKFSFFPSSDFRDLRK